MLEELKRKILRAKLVWAAVFLAAGLGLAVYLLPTITGLILGPKDLYSLTADQLEGAYVTADLDTILDWYAETVQSKKGSLDRTTAREYLIPTADAYIGLEVPSSMIKTANAVMKDTQAWLSDRSGSYVSDGSHLQVTGTIHRMDRETLGFYNELLGYYFSDSQREALCYPLVLECNAVGRTPAGLHWLALLGMGGCLFVGLWFLVRSLNGAYLRPITRYVKTQPDPDAALAQLDRLYEQEPVFGKKVKLDRSWLIYDSGAESFVLSVRDIAWVFASVTQHRRNGIPTGKTYAVAVCGKSEPKNKRRHLIPTASEQDSRDLIARIHAYAPDAVYGYDAAFNRPYDKDPEAFVREMQARRAAAAAQTPDEEGRPLY